MPIATISYNGRCFLLHAIDLRRRFHTASRRATKMSIERFALVCYWCHCIHDIAFAQIEIASIWPDADLWYRFAMLLLRMDMLFFPLRSGRFAAQLSFSRWYYDAPLSPGYFADRLYSGLLIAFSINNAPYAFRPICRHYLLCAFSNMMTLPLLRDFIPLSFLPLCGCRVCFRWDFCILLAWHCYCLYILFECLRCAFSLAMAAILITLCVFVYLPD